MRCNLYGFLIIKSKTTLHYAVWCTVNCGAVQLCYFVGSFYGLVNTPNHIPIQNNYLFPRIT